MPLNLQAAIQRANWDDEVHAILLYGAGNAFCAGYDLIKFAEGRKDDGENDEEVPTYVNQDMPWDPALDYQ